LFPGKPVRERRRISLVMRSLGQERVSSRHLTDAKASWIEFG